MLIGNVDVTRDMMPSYDDYNQNPSHLYQLKQMRLRQLLQVQPMNMQQPAPTGNGVTQSERWSND